MSTVRIKEKLETEEKVDVDYSDLHPKIKMKDFYQNGHLKLLLPPEKLKALEEGLKHEKGTFCYSKGYLQEELKIESADRWIIRQEVAPNQYEFIIPYKQLNDEGQTKTVLLGTGASAKVKLMQSTTGKLHIAKVEHIKPDDKNPEKRSLEINYFFINEAPFLKKLGRSQGHLIPKKRARSEKNKPIARLRITDQFAPGEELFKILKESNEEPYSRVLSPYYRFEIFLKLCDRVEELHKMDGTGWIHRDIKPANIICFIDPKTGAVTVTLVDFGFVKKLPPSGVIQDVYQGTVNYAAPEVRRKRASSYSMASDIFAMGLTAQFLFRFLGNGISNVEKWSNNEAGQVLYLLDNMKHKKPKRRESVGFWKNKALELRETYFNRIGLQRKISQKELSPKEQPTLKKR